MLCHCSSHCIPSPLFNINIKPNHQRRSRTNRKQEREPLPIILHLVNDRLHDVRPHHRRSAVRKAVKLKELRMHRSTFRSGGKWRTTDHVVEPRRTQFGHHRLRAGPPNMSHQNSQTLWNLDESGYLSRQEDVLITTYPNLSVHMPIIPHGGIRVVTALVTTNCGQ